MKPIRINIKGEFSDAYLYSGYLFTIRKNGEFSALSLSKLLSEKLDDRLTVFERKFIKNIFLRNDWFSNAQAKGIFSHPDMSKGLSIAWERTSKYIEIDTNENDFIHLSKLPENPILDLKIYGLSCFFGGRDGLFRLPLAFNNDTKVSTFSKIMKISDARIIYINPKSGVLMLSAGSDGLLLGKFEREENDSSVSVDDKIYANKSIRTGWTGYDSVNYLNNKNPIYLSNEWERESERQYFYSKNDETNEKRSLKKFCSQEFSVQDFSDIDISGVDYFFNTTGKLFTIEKGQIRSYEISLRDNEHTLKVKERSTMHSFIETIKLPQENVLNAYQLPNGTILEYFNSVVFITNNEIYNLETVPVLGVKTFLTSRRYKRIICIIKPNSISLHATFPEAHHVT